MFIYEASLEIEWHHCKFWALVEVNWGELASPGQEDER